MDVTKGTMVVIVDPEQLKNPRFGLVIGATPKENNPDNHDLFEVRKADGNIESVKREEMVLVGNVTKLWMPDDVIKSMPFEDAFQIALPDILLTILSKIYNLKER